MHRVLLTGAAAFLCISSCSNGAKEELSAGKISIKKDKITAEAAAVVVNLEIEADKDWGVGSNATEWCKVSPSGGIAGKYEVSVRISENLTQVSREAKITFRCGSTRKVVDVSQEGAAEESYIPKGYSLVWNDEFDGSSVDFSKWRFENWAPGHVNHELQRYVTNGEIDGAKTAFIEKGILNIKAQSHNGQVISARMNSQKSWLYGYMEARIKLPKGKGTWPAYWMMPDNFSLGWPKCGEIDIMEEVGANANYTSSSIHCDSYNHVKGTQKTKEQYTANAESDFHIYALEWTSDYIRTYVDGKILLDFANDKKGNLSTWPFNKNFYIILNLAWGGDWGGYKGVDASALPCTMQVDYVRVFQKK